MGREEPAGVTFAAPHGPDLEHAAMLRNPGEAPVSSR
jgi:hypothetical protein